MREVGNRLDDLARALAAGDDDHDVDRRELRYEVLQHGLAGAERPRDAAGTAACYRKERVDQALLCDQRLGGILAFAVALDEQALGEWHAHGPFLGKLEFPLVAAIVANRRNGLLDAHVAFLHPVELPPSAEIERHHDAVLVAALLHRADDVAGDEARTVLHLRYEGPLLVYVERVDVRAALQEEAVTVGYLLQRVLQPVVNLPEQARAEIDRQHPAGLHDRVADLNAARVLEDLRDRRVTVDAQDLGLEPLVAAGRADVDHLVLDDWRRILVADRLDDDKIVLDGHDPRRRLGHCAANVLCFGGTHDSNTSCRLSPMHSAASPRMRSRAAASSWRVQRSMRSQRST